MTDTVFPIDLHLMARDSAVSYLGTFGMLALGMATKVLLARALTPGDFGLLIIAQTIVGLALTLAQLSLPDAVVRFVGLYAGHDLAKAKGVLAGVLRLNLPLAVLMALGLSASAGWIADRVYQQAPLAGALAVLALAMPFTAAADALAAAFRGISQLWVKVVLVDLGRVLWAALGVWLLIALNASSLLAVAGVYTTAVVVSAALTLGLFARSQHWRVQAAPAPVGDLLRYSLPLVGSSLVAWPMTAIPLVLASAVSPQAVAYYNLAMALTNFIYMPTGAIDTAALPVWSGRIAQGAIGPLRAAYVFTARWCLIAGLAIFAPLVLCPAEITGLLYGPNYRVAAPVVQAMAVLALLNAATGPNESLLRAFGYTRQIFIARLVAGGGALVVAVALIPAWGMPGALISLGVSSILGIGVYVLSLLRAQAIHPLDGPYLKTALAGALALLLASLVQGYLGEGLWRIALSALLYNALLASLLFALRVFTVQEVRALNAAYRQVKGLFSKIARHLCD